MAYVDRLTWYLTNVPGVLSAQSLPTLTKLAASGVNEGNPKWASLPQEELTLGEAVRQVPEGAAPLQRRVHPAAGQPLPSPTTRPAPSKRWWPAVKVYRDTNPFPGVTVRLASGNAGVQAATNEVVEHSELPMMLYVYATILVLVFLVYRDWRAMIACCVPLTLATFLGYWFMKSLDIGLTVATLPVMVLGGGHRRGLRLLHLQPPADAPVPRRGHRHRLQAGPARGGRGHRVHRRDPVHRRGHLVLLGPSSSRPTWACC